MEDWADFKKLQRKTFKEIVIAILEKRWSSALISALFSVIGFLFRLLEKKL